MTQKRWNTPHPNWWPSAQTTHQATARIGIKRRHLCISYKGRFGAQQLVQRLANRHRPTRTYPKATSEQYRRASLDQSMQKHLVGYDAKPKLAAGLPRYEATQPLASIGIHRQTEDRQQCIPRRSRTQSAFAGCRPTRQARLMPPVEHLPSIIWCAMLIHPHASVPGRNSPVGMANRASCWWLTWFLLCFGPCLAASTVDGGGGGSNWPTWGMAAD